MQLNKSTNYFWSIKIITINHIPHCILTQKYRQFLQRNQNKPPHLVINHLIHIFLFKSQLIILIIIFKYENIPPARNDKQISLFKITKKFYKMICQIVLLTYCIKQKYNKFAYYCGSQLLNSFLSQFQKSSQYEKLSTNLVEKYLIQKHTIIEFQSFSYYQLQHIVFRNQHYFSQRHVFLDHIFNQLKDRNQSNLRVDFCESYKIKNYARYL
eukprot:TRINITY_DN5908_c0_g1_i6.p1 TRINITY_DN5908_c0_g1~~TRINITY_DN5908_c0_g1_i6.p1  ORF type:complete len:212 (+),score=-17.39 TRINITY_DN5908_c0_g1_i6:174-809(+)